MLWPVETVPGSWLKAFVGAGLVGALGASPLASAGDGTANVLVVVVVDMDPLEPGFQNHREVPAGTQRVEGISIWVYDPSETATIYGVGYIGGLDRSIAFGHVPDKNTNRGLVASVSGTVGQPIVPGHFAYITDGIEKLFAGPEFQYIETGDPGVIPASPTEPIVWVDVELSEARIGDVFRFYVGDMTRVWLSGGGGAFSTRGFLSLDTGGDAVPDRTPTVFGLDADAGVPVPPAAFPVDFVDGPLTGGGATIAVVPAPGDFDGDGDVDLSDFTVFQLCFGGSNNPPATTCPPGIDADLDGDGDVDLADFIIFQQNFTGSL